MQSITLVFDLDNVDPEDSEILEYLESNDLLPRNQFVDSYEDKDNCHVMEFGGCYMGRHLEAVAFIQRESVETELLTDFVVSHVDFEQYPISKNKLIESLISILRSPESFVIKDNAELSVNLSEDDLSRGIDMVLS